MQKPSFDKTNIRFECINDPKKAKELWIKLTTAGTIYNDWDFRYFFYEKEKFPLHFYAGFVGEEPIGLLPLQFNTRKNFLEFFGGDFMEYNQVFIKPGFEDKTSLFYQQIDKQAKLRSISSKDLVTTNLPIDDDTYFLHLQGLDTIEDFLTKIFPKAKSRSTFRRKIRDVEKEKIEIVNNNFKDLDLLIQFNKEMFPEDSHFFDEDIVSAFRNLLHSKFQIEMISVLVNGKTESVSYSLKYNGYFYYMLSGTNRNSLPNLGTYIIYLTLKRALDLKAGIFDAGRSNCNWKERWHLEKIPQYKYFRGLE